ncbi:MAG: ArsR/SmtB family transcription factor [Candidatus Nanoarchaeia archaeon]
MEKDILINLNDEKTKAIADILSSKTCISILDILAEQELTESEIASKLNKPLNTIEYNIKKLVNAGLIESKNHFWSIKGKKMPSYKLANKKIVISPKPASRLKKFAIPLILTGIGAAIIAVVNKPKNVETNRLMDTNIAILEASGSVGMNLPAWQWFLIGAWLSILIFFIISLIYERRKNG